MYSNFNDLKTKIMTAKEFLQKMYKEDDHYYGDEFWYSMSINEMQNILEDYHQAKLKLLDIPAVMVELACPRCGSTNTTPSDKENDAGCYECGFVWQDN